MCDFDENEKTYFSPHLMYFSHDVAETTKLAQ